MSLMRGAYLWLMAARAPPPQSLAMVAMGALSIQTLADTGTFRSVGESSAWKAARWAALRLKPQAERRIDKSLDEAQDPDGARERLRATAPTIHRMRLVSR